MVLAVAEGVLQSTCRIVTVHHDVVLLQWHAAAPCHHHFEGKVPLSELLLLVQNFSSDSRSGLA